MSRGGGRKGLPPSPLGDSFRQVNAVLRPAFGRRVPLLLLAGTLGCGDVAGSGGLDALSQLEGSWRATEWLIEADSGSREVDLVAQAGVALELVIRSDGRTSGTLVAVPVHGATAESQPFTGTLVVHDARMELAFDPDLRLFGEVLDRWEVTYTLSGFSLTWEDPGTRWDFDLSGPGAQVETRTTVVLQRVS